jgi:hypothetical protein
VNDTTATSGSGLAPDSKVNLLSVYATQFGSYTTLLWQVPALSLTAQSFLLTIALGSDSSDYARYIAAGLSVIIAVSSWALMHDQRGHAINYGELARRLSKQLDLMHVLECELNEDDAVPRITNAELVWADKASRTRSGLLTIPKLSFVRSSLMYSVWRACMLLFLLADGIVIISTLLGYHWFAAPRS